MIEYFRENVSQVSDGLLFGLGLLTVYFGAVITGAIIRSLGGAGSAGLTVLGRYALAELDHEADLLRMARNRPVLVTENINVDRAGTVVEFGIGCYPTPRVQIVFEPGEDPT